MSASKGTSGRRNGSTARARAVWWLGHLVSAAAGVAATQAYNWWMAEPAKEIRIVDTAERPNGIDLFFDPELGIYRELGPKDFSFAVD